MKHLERALDKQNQWWKYLVIFISGFVTANLIGALPLLIVIVIKIVKSGGVGMPNPDNLMDLSVYGIHPNIGLVLLIVPFVVGLITVALLFKPLHKRTWKEVINGTNSIRWERFFFAMIIWGCMMGIYLLFDYYTHPDNFIIQLNLTSFIPLIIISLLLIPFQSTFEELLFRGYLAQGVAAWTRSRWLAIIIPALLFTFMHSLNPEVKEYGFWLTMPQYMIFGLIFGLTTILDDGIEIAMGAHAANNIFISIFISNEASALQTTALFEQLRIDQVRETWMLLLVSLVFITILTLKYKWKFSVLNRKVEKLTPNYTE